MTAFAVADPVGALPDLDPRLAHLTESGELQGTSGATSVLHLDDGGHLVAAGAGRRDELETRRRPWRGYGSARRSRGGSTTPSRFP